MSSSGKDKQKSPPSRGKSPKSPKSQCKKRGGAPRKYTKGKSNSSKNDSMDPIPGNQNWGRLARKGVLRVHHDDVKAAEAQTNRPAPFEEVIEDTAVYFKNNNYKSLEKAVNYCLNNNMKTHA